MKPSVLIVDDEVLIGLDLAETVAGGGYGVVGPFCKPEDALAAIDRAKPDAAILDINLGKHGTSKPIAERLARLNVPFVALSGYGRAGALDSVFEDAAFMSKPFEADRVLAKLSEFFRA